MYACDDTEEAYVVGYVSKMFAVPYGDLPRTDKEKEKAKEKVVPRGHRPPVASPREENQPDPTTYATPDSAPAAPSADSINPSDTPTPITLENVDETAASAPSPAVNPEAEILLGFARLYSGTLRTNSTIYYLLPKYNTAHPPSHPSNSNRSHIGCTKVTALYEMMGRELLRVEEVRAGNVFALEGLGGVVGRNATICAPRAEGVLEKGDDEHVVVEGDEECLVNLAGVNQQVLDAKQFDLVLIVLMIGNRSRLLLSSGSP